MINDGLDALRAEIGVGEITSLIERTARWVAPGDISFASGLVPGTFPPRPNLQNNWSEPQMNKTRKTGSQAISSKGISMPIKRSLWRSE